MRGRSFLLILPLLLGCSQKKPSPCIALCQNGGECVQGQCQCNLPYWGESCEEDVRMQFIGPWEGRRDCKGVRSGLRYEMWQDSFVSRTLYLAGPIYGDYLDTLAGQLVSFNRMRFSRQMLQDTALEVEGWAERWQDSLLIQLDVRGGIGSSTTCKWLLKKR